jgi:hypothetical protein
LSNTKEQIISLLKSTNRPGIEKVIEYLNNSDFFKAPASTKYHNSFEGGLAEHSFNVYAVLKDKVSSLFPERLSKDTVILTALLHDLCKINFYVKGFRNVKENGVWVQKEVWEVKDQEPMGHGEKSLWLLSKMIELTDQEAYMIRYHMGFTEPKDTWIHLNNALDKHPEIILLHTADLEATYMIEGREKK